MPLNLRGLFGVSSSGIVSRISVSNTVASILLSANTNRKGFCVENESGTLYIKLGSNASSTDYTVSLTSAVGGNRYEVAGYNGIVTARKASGTTFVDVTSFE